MITMPVVQEIRVDGDVESPLQQARSADEATLEQQVARLAMATDTPMPGSNPTSPTAGAIVQAERHEGIEALARRQRAQSAGPTRTRTLNHRGEWQMISTPPLVPSETSTR